MNRQLNQRRPADRLFRLFPDLAGRRADPLRADAGFFRILRHGREYSETVTGSLRKNTRFYTVIGVFMSGVTVTGQANRVWHGTAAPP